MEKNDAEVMSEFWMTVIEKLNSDMERKQMLVEVLADICRYFHYGCSFVYMADHQGSFHLYESYQASEHYRYLDDRIDLNRELGQKLAQSLQSDKDIMFDEDTPKSVLEEELCRVFQAQSMLIVPVKARGMKVTALVGMLDRRGKNRNNNQALPFAVFILTVVANYISTMEFQRKNEEAMKILRKVLDNTGVNVYVIDFYTDEILYVNQVMANEYGSEACILGKKCWEVFGGGHGGSCQFCPKTKMVDENHEPAEPYIWNYYNERDNTWKRMISAAFYWVDGRLASVMSYVDITESVRNEEKIRQYAEYDTLTGLQNRHKLLLDCDDGIDYLRENGKEGYFIFCDLDRFKSVNDIYGHQVGDELLRALGAYFQSNEQTRDRTYRYAGDEFVILCLDDTKAQVESLIARIYEDFQVPWQLSIGALTCKVSLGLTCYPGDAQTTSDLLHSADMAMYAYKKETYKESPPQEHPREN